MSFPRVYIPKKKTMYPIIKSWKFLTEVKVCRSYIRAKEKKKKIVLPFVEKTFTLNCDGGINQYVRQNMDFLFSLLKYFENAIVVISRELL